VTTIGGWPPVLEGVSDRAREAQTTVIYGGDLMVGVWPWGEVWRYNPDSCGWNFMRRMFTHPELSSEITHPYDVENHDNSPQNMWGQRVTSLVANGPDLFISTSAKAPYEWKPETYPFLAPDKWKSYGKVYRATMPGHLSVTTKWTDGPTRLEFMIGDREISIHQDGVVLAQTFLIGSLAERTDKARSLKNLKWGTGIFGPHRCVALKGAISIHDSKTRKIRIAYDDHSRTDGVRTCHRSDRHRFAPRIVRGSYLIEKLAAVSISIPVEVS